MTISSPARASWAIAAVVADPLANAIPWRAALEVRHRALEAAAGGILAAGVLLAAARPADAVLGVGEVW